MLCAKTSHRRKSAHLARDALVKGRPDALFLSTGMLFTALKKSANGPGSLGHNKWICGSEHGMYVWERLHVQGRRISVRARRRQKITDSHPFFFKKKKKKFL